MPRRKLVTQMNMPALKPIDVAGKDKSLGQFQTPIGFHLEHASLPLAVSFV